MGRKTIATLARFLDIGPERTAKAAFFMTGDGRFIVAIVRGDYDVNETKLVNAVKAIRDIRPATVEEIKARGMEPGYGSPIGARDASYYWFGFDSVVPAALQYAKTPEGSKLLPPIREED